MEHTPIPLPRFLKLFTSNNVPIAQAMAVAGKMSVAVRHTNNPLKLHPSYKEFNTPAKLSALDEVS
jgi:hypothetical protein